jgi:quercetin dioxygenase-like cupin family protein
MKKLLVFAALTALAGSALAQDVMKPMAVAPEALTWKDNPALPPGAQTAVVFGDPTKAGEIFVQRIKLPPNWRVPAHTHPYTGYETVISGGIYVGEGDKFDPQKGDLHKAGSFSIMPAKHAHYAWTTNEGVVLQLQAVGPGGIDYINPADDPRKKTQ